MGLDSDESLWWRVAATLGAVLAVNLLAVGAVATALSRVVGPLIDGAPSVAVRAGLTLVLLAVALAVQLRSARAAALAAVDTVEHTGESHPELRARLDRLARVAEATPPSLAVVEESTPNSFSVGGRDPVVVLSTGLIDRLDDAELDAVLAHEFAHVRNRDATVLTLAGFLPTLVSDEPIAGVPSWARSNLVGAVLVVAVTVAGVGAGLTVPALAVAAAVGLVLGGILLGVVATPVVYLARRLSHDREFVADRAAARLTGDPAALASALRTLDGDAPPTPESDLRTTGGMRTELCLLPGGFGTTEPDEGSFTIRLRTHPDTDERIQRLRDIAAGQ